MHPRGLRELQPTAALLAYPGLGKVFNPRASGVFEIQEQDSGPSGETKESAIERNRFIEYEERPEKCRSAVRLRSNELAQCIPSHPPRVGTLQQAFRIDMPIFST